MWRSHIRASVGCGALVTKHSSVTAPRRADATSAAGAPTAAFEPRMAAALHCELSMALVSHPSLAVIAFAHGPRSLLVVRGGGCRLERRRELEASDAGVYCEEAGRFAARGGVVLDLSTDAGGVEWQQDVAPASFTQEGAKACCGALDLDGSGWRLPTVYELESLVVHPIGLGGSRPTCVPSIDQVAFPATPVASFWSSVTQPRDSWYTNFRDGRSHPGDPSTLMSERCVRAQHPICEVRAPGPRPA